MQKIIYKQIKEMKTILLNDFDQDLNKATVNTGFLKDVNSVENGEHDDKGTTSQPIDIIRLQKLVDRIRRTSNVDFVKRLLNSKRRNFNGKKSFRPDGNTFREGGRKYNEYADSVQHVNKTEEQFLKDKADAMRRWALYRSLTRTTGINPIYRGKEDYGCIWTETDNYGEQYRTMDNRTFRDNAAKIGFIPIPLSDVLPGDIVQRGYLQNPTNSSSFIPRHALIFNRFDENGQPRYNHYTGEPNGRGIIRKDAIYYPTTTYPFDENNYRAYRFVGAPEDLENWRREFRQYNEAHPPMSPLQKISLVLPTLVPLPDDKGLVRN